MAAAVLPARMTRGVGERTAVLAAHLPVSSGRFAGPGRRRQLVASHLRRVYGPDLPPRELDRRVDEAFASYGRYWAECMQLRSLGPAQISAGMTYEGLENIVAGEEAGRGTILAVAHLGGWDWGGSDLARTGHPISVVVEELEPPEMFRWFASFRERLGMHVIPMGPHAAAACSQALAANQLLCLLCDRIVGDAAAVEVEFFGERTMMPAGPAVLALRTGAVLLPAVVYFGPKLNQHVGVIRPALDLRRQGRLRDDVQTVTQHIARELEGLIRRAPTQWHLMHPNWPSDHDLPLRY